VGQLVHLHANIGHALARVVPKCPSARAVVMQAWLAGLAGWPVGWLAGWLAGGQAGSVSTQMLQRACVRACKPVCWGPASPKRLEASTRAH
jgi:hypothetical protein